MKSIIFFLIILTLTATSYAQLQDQIIVDPENPMWFVYNKDSNNDGKLDPFFLCGPGDPEGFLYRGAKNADGTRTGDQIDIINKLKTTGANSIYLIAVRSHGGDGNSTQNPFINNDPANALNQDILNQWETWFTEMDNNDILIYFVFYDDSSDMYLTSSMGASEAQFIRDLVNRFEHHKNLIWVVAEEYSEKLTKARVSQMASEIRNADNNNHPIAVHQIPKMVFDFPDDVNIDQFSIQISGSTNLHNDVLTAWSNANGRYNLNMAEAPNWGTGLTSRKKIWETAMAGAYVMVLGWDVINTNSADLSACGSLVNFFESKPVNEMAPHDELAYGGTQYVLANPGSSYIAYASSLSGNIGIKNMQPGTYNLVWLDIPSNTVVNENGVSVISGDNTFTKPNGFSNEIALYIKSLNQTYQQKYSCLSDACVEDSNGNYNSLSSCSMNCGASQTDFCENNGVISVEAEHFSENFGYTYRTDTQGGKASGFSGQGWMYSENDTAIKMDYLITFENAGTYYVHLRTLAGYTKEWTSDASGIDNGFFIEIDGNRVLNGGVADIYVKKTQSWNWFVKPQGSADGVPITFQISSPGQHIFSIIRRELLGRIDKFVIHDGIYGTDSAGSLSGIGPDETLCNGNNGGSLVNQPPVAQTKNVLAQAGSETNIQLLYTDSDGPGPYTVEIANQPQNGALTGTGNDRFYTPNQGFSGSDSFTWRVFDGETYSNTATVNIDVIQEPSASSLINDISVITNKTYQIGSLASSAKVYIDRIYIFTNIPSVYQGSEFIMTANDDKSVINNNFLSFGLMSGATVFVAYNDKILQKPAWLSGWTDTGQDIQTSDANFSVLKKNYAAGNVVLGGNEGGSNSMYFVFAEAANNPPIVSADNDKTAYVNITIQLMATSTDQEGNAMTYSWSKISGPGIVSFTNQNSETTTVTFSAAGNYVLTFIANDGELSSSDSVAVTVELQPPNTQAEWMNYDLNKDNKIDLQDLQIIARNFFKQSNFEQEADADNNGKVNLLDFVRVLKYYGSSGS